MPGDHRRRRHGDEENRSRRRRRHRRRSRSSASGSDGSAVSAPASNPCRSGSSQSRKKKKRQRRRRREKKQREESSSGGEGAREAEPRRNRREHGPPHIDWSEGLTLGDEGRYVVEKLFGDGASGRVLGCRDEVAGKFVAVKVCRNARRQRRHAENEVEMLRRLQEHDPEAARQYVVHLLDAFEHDEGQLCLVFEPLAMSLRGLLNEAEGGLYLADIRSVAQQLLNCFSFFQSLGLVHGDLKCTNVMLRKGDFQLLPHPRAEHADMLAARPCWPFEVVVIDYGLATLTDPENGTAYRGVRVGARHIRSPEVILGLDWGCQTDLWSLGCLLATLYSCERLFAVHDEMEHLAGIERVTEQKIPIHMVPQIPERILNKGVVFDESCRLAWPECARDERQVRKVNEMSSLSEMVLKRHSSFLSLLRGLLEIDAQQRLSANAGLAHPFLTAAPLSEDASDE
eukprot:TRINITY_DN20125_c0_g1_i1.p1 TRINITY_DN20125_c0_g1~~TRINITY_DN20125_c0_g1_i1.p1  ORF type:complete len:456 (-),score=69.00 TRINITY_DN20125_c0_g1_i1:8-1375(-)